MKRSYLKPLFHHFGKHKVSDCTTFYPFMIYGIVETPFLGMTQIGIDVFVLRLKFFGNRTKYESFIQRIIKTQLGLIFINLN